MIFFQILSNSSFQYLSCKSAVASANEYYKSVNVSKREKNVTGTTFGSTNPYGLLSITGALDWIIIALDGGLHRIIRRALGRLRAAVMLQRLIMRRSDRRIKCARDGANIVKTGA